MSRTAPAKAGLVGTEQGVWCLGDLLEIAENDLSAADVLRREGFIPQSIFFTSQSVEKILKSILLLNGNTVCENLPRSVGHEPFRRGFMKLFRRLAAEYEKALPELSLLTGGAEDNMIIKLMRKAQTELPKFLEYVQEELEEIDALYKELGGNPAEADELLNLCIMTLEDGAKQLRNLALPKLRPSDEELEELTRNLNQALPSQQQIIKEKVRQAIEVINQAMEPLAKLAISMEGLLYLQALFEATEASTTTRYPITPNKGPKEIQNIIPTQKLQKIHEALKQIIPHVKTAIKQLKTQQQKTKENT